MIIDLVDKLIDRVIQLSQQHKAAKKAIFMDYVVPTYESLMRCRRRTQM